MSSITQNYEYLLKRVIEKIDCSKFDVFQGFKRTGDVLNYVNFSNYLIHLYSDAHTCYFFLLVLNG